MVHKPVPRIDASSPTAADELYTYYKTGQSPVVVEKALDVACTKHPMWEIEALRTLVSGCGGEAAHEEVRAMVRDDKCAPTRYREMQLPSIDAYFRHVIATRDSGGSQKCGLQNGFQLPMQSLSSSGHTVPTLLRALHGQRKVPLRDMLGRKFARLFVSTSGYHGRCHYDRLGLPFFTAQVRGEKTWWLYSPSSLTLDRKESFDNAPDIDFADTSVRSQFEGYEATIRQGDLLLVPPFFYHHVKHQGRENVNVDFACAPCPVWAHALTSCQLPTDDVVGLLGSRAFLCVGLPAALLPDSEALTKSRMYLIAASFHVVEARITMDYLSRRRREQLESTAIGCASTDASCEYSAGSADSERRLDACKESAASNGVDSQLLETCVACEFMFRDATSVMYALSRLVHHLGNDEEAHENLLSGVRLVKSVVDEMKDQDKGTREFGLVNTESGKLSSDDLRKYDSERITALFTALFGDYYERDVE